MWMCVLDARCSLSLPLENTQRSAKQTRRACDCVNNGSPDYVDWGMDVVADQWGLVCRFVTNS